MFEMIRGDSASFTTTVYTNSTKITPQNLSSVTEATFTARKGVNGAIVFQKTLSGGVVITDAANGLVTTTLVSSDTSSLPANVQRLHYDLELRWAGGIVHTVDIGDLNVVPDVSY